jgi:hypothetical protein
MGTAAAADVAALYLLFFGMLLAVEALLVLGNPSANCEADRMAAEDDPNEREPDPWRILLD